MSSRIPGLSLVESEHARLETEVDFLGDAENIKTLFKLPYSNSTVSLAIHKLGNTLIVDGEQEHEHASPPHQQSAPTALPAPDEPQSARERDMFEQFIYESYMAAKDETDNTSADHIESAQERDMFEQFIYESYMAAKAENEQGPGNVSDSEGSERDLFEQFIYKSYMAAKEDEEIREPSPERHRSFSPPTSPAELDGGGMKSGSNGGVGALVKGGSESGDMSRGQQLDAEQQGRAQGSAHMGARVGLHMGMHQSLAEPNLHGWAGVQGGPPPGFTGLPPGFSPQSFGGAEGTNGSMTNEYRQVVSWKFHEMNIVTNRYA
jgi:hypothetical protein